ncbi:uncharacterized protein JN550_011508 [Neoarthrinium moseri]|uniref:uncharacterized protein n=1 Tax=Neoarthrinium moseri TaxID=1658444 RepID=UPI001FDADE04|nr:uncharacterized protein JN550_011508 [Neoarthrinium moseri]KAI1860356.1 hypothetical protein JN550_011508 [Neoarthrinium moseri]
MIGLEIAGAAGSFLHMSREAARIISGIRAASDEIACRKRHLKHLYKQIKILAREVRQCYVDAAWETIKSEMHHCKTMVKEFLYKYRSGSLSSSIRYGISRDRGISVIREVEGSMNWLLVEAQLAAMKQETRRKQKNKSLKYTGIGAFGGAVGGAMAGALLCRLNEGANKKFGLVTGIGGLIGALCGGVLGYLRAN